MGTGTRACGYLDTCIQEDTLSAQTGGKRAETASSSSKKKVKMQKKKKKSIICRPVEKLNVFHVIFFPGHFHRPCCFKTTVASGQVRERLILLELSLLLLTVELLEQEL